MAARRSLAEIVADIHRTKKTGLLSLVVKGTGNHFKMFFREGEAYHVTCGDSRAPDCLATIDGFDFSECFFVPDVKLNVPGKGIPATAEIIRRLEASGKTVESHGLDRGRGDATPAERSGMGRLMDGLKTALIRQIGPVGGKVFSRIVEEKWRASSPPTREQILHLVNLLKDEIEDGNGKNEFAAEAARIVS